MNKLERLAANDTFKEVEGLIYKLVHSCHRRTGIEFQELESFALEEFVKCIEEYDSSKAAFTTFVYSTIKWKLINYTRKKKNDRIQLFEEMENLEVFASKETDPFFISDFLSELNIDCKIICRLVLEVGDDFDFLIHNKNPTPTLFKKKLRKLLKAKEWENWEIDEAFEEIRSKLKKYENKN